MHSVKSFSYFDIVSYHYYHYALSTDVSPNQPPILNRPATVASTRSAKSSTPKDSNRDHRPILPNNHSNINTTGEKSSTASLNYNIQTINLQDNDAEMDDGDVPRTNVAFEQTVDERSTLGHYLKKRDFFKNSISHYSLIFKVQFNNIIYRNPDDGNKTINFENLQAVLNDQTLKTTEKERINKLAQLFLGYVGETLF